MGCVSCGAAIELSTGKATTCRFCGSVNNPLPTEVDVPVPVQIVHNVVQVVDGKGLVESRCPHCRKRLVGVDVDGVQLQGCARCGGVWVDNASALRILGAPKRIFIELSARAATNAYIGAPRVAQPVCAVCPAMLDKTAVHRLSLDICPEHGTWFDAHELAALTRVLLGEPTANQTASKTVVCTGCSATIPTATANVTGNGMQCDLCWRQQQASLIKQWDASTGNNATTQAGAGLLGAIVIGALVGAAGASARR
jgi:Zn-finger nucleic acid-binding protein